MKFSSLKRVLGITMLALCWQVGAADLFGDGKLRDISARTKWTAEDTQGGYAIYPGEAKWEFFSGAVLGTSGPDSIILGRSSWGQYEDGNLFARLDLTVNLNTGATTRSWGGTPCAPGHLIAVNKPRGREDNCMTVDAVSNKVGTVDVTLLRVRITNTAGAGRYYVMDLLLNPQLLGHWNTATVEWSAEQLVLRPDRKEFLARVGAWAEQLQTATNVAFGNDKPQDAFKDMPSFRTLMPVSDDLAPLKYNQIFLSALEDLKYRKSFKAMAMSMRSDGRIWWYRFYGKETQAEADQSALQACNKDKPASYPECRPYPLQ
jgi:hypothetical protein